MKRRHGTDAREQAESVDPIANGAGEDLEAGPDRARRRLLQLGLYVPPAVIGSLLISRGALAQAGGSCGPVCQPYCTPNCAPKQGCTPNCVPKQGCNPNR